LTPEIALINAVRARLKADSSVTALVGTSTFDQVPDQTVPPYVYIGPAARARIPIDCGQVWTVNLRIYAISSGYGRDEDWEIAEAIVQSLDLKDLPLAAPFEMQQAIQINRAGDVIDPAAPKSVFVDIQTTIGRDS